MGLRDSGDLGSLIFGKHDDGRMNTECVGQLLGASLADIESVVFKLAEIAGADAAAAGQFFLGLPLELPQHPNDLSRGDLRTRLCRNEV